MIEKHTTYARVIAIRNFYIPNITVTSIGQTEDGFFCHLNDERFLAVTEEGYEFSTKARPHTILREENYTISSDIFLFRTVVSSSAELFPVAKIFHIPTGTLYFYSPRAQVCDTIRTRPEPKTFQSRKVRKTILFPAMHNITSRKRMVPLYAKDDLFIFYNTHNILSILDVSYPALQIFGLPTGENPAWSLVCVKRKDHYDLLVVIPVSMNWQYWIRLSRIWIALPEGESHV